tara:strand:+ start:2931 stop:3659 length:729 start_codon:yes stop_codon:yes gene_type:complete
MNETVEAEVTEAPVEAERDFVVAEDAEPARPEWLPEKYKTGEELAKAYKELSSKLGGKEEEIRKAYAEELQVEAYKDRPESVGDYQLPESVDTDSAVDNELLQWWSDHAFENGFGQSEFEKGIEMYAQAVGGNQPDLEAEASLLGENAQDRIESASMFANKFFPEESLPAIERMCESHEGIIALEAIQEAMKDGSFSGDLAPPSSLTEDGLKEMMQDPRYWSKNDPSFVREVEAGYKKLYGG